MHYMCSLSLIPMSLTNHPQVLGTHCLLQVISIWSSALLSLVTTRINQASNHNQESDMGQGDHAEQVL